MTDGEAGDANVRTVTLRCPFCQKWNRIDMNRAAGRPKCGECERPILLDRPVRILGEDLQRVISSATVPVLIDFYADWCGPCKVMAPVLDDFARDHTGTLLVGKVDTDAAQVVASALGIRGIPTLILFRDGTEVARQTGAVPRSGLDALLPPI